MGVSIAEPRSPSFGWADVVGEHETLAPQADLVRVFDYEPDLLADVDARSADHLRRRAAAPRLWVEAGNWVPPRDDAVRRSFGLLVLDGLMTRSISLFGRECPEIVGVGDLLRPWEDGHTETSIGASATWTALERTSLAILDERFADVVCRWPGVITALMSRSVQRSRSVSFHFAIAHVRHADTRLLMLLWHLADRWGRVTPAGVHVPLRLTHELMARLACMRRPTASTALQRLSRRGELLRRSDGTWLLTGDPPTADAARVGCGNAA